MEIDINLVHDTVIYNKETKETFGDAGARVINTFLEGAPEFREVIKKTMTGGQKGGFFTRNIILFGHILV